jgi:hypothetical protein
MKDVNQYRDELIRKITTEVMQKMPELICKKMDEYEIAYDEKIAEAMIEIYTEGLNEGLSRATQTMQYAMLYKATSQLLKGDDEK